MIRPMDSLAVSYCVRLALAAILVVAVAAPVAQAQSTRPTSPAAPASGERATGAPDLTGNTAPTHRIEYLRKGYSVAGPATVVSASPEKIVLYGTPKKTTINLKGKKVTVQKASLTSASLQDIQPKSKIYIFTKKGEMIIKLATTAESSPTQQSGRTPRSSKQPSAKEPPQH